ncbi:MAG: hypothetical protein HDT29_00915 [Clostridiales bacterium]|nr:hypothetical protein [Clostridiales bacterium]
MKINTLNWKEFKIDSLFNIERGKISNLNELEIGKCPVVSAYGENQGISFFGNITPQYSNCITASFNGSKTGYFSYHEYAFNANADCGILLPKFPINKCIGLFMCVVLNRMSIKYQYGRKLTIDRLRDEAVLLPCKNEEPNFEYMEDYIKTLKYKEIKTNNVENKNLNLNVDSWQEFEIGKLFQLKKCKCGNAGALEDGNGVPYIGAKKSENGVMKTVNIDNSLLTKGNCIVFICDGQGSVGYSNYMEKDFIGSTTLTVGYNKNLNKYNALFIVSVLDKERYKYSYGRKYGPHLANSIIKLPTKDNNPDWNFMEDYIKSLQFADRI